MVIEPGRFRYGRGTPILATEFITVAKACPVQSVSSQYADPGESLLGIYGKVGVQRHLLGLGLCLVTDGAAYMDSSHL